MPVYKRRFFLNRFNEEMEIRKSEIEKANSKNQTKGKKR